MTNFQNSYFIKSATKKEERPNTNLPEILFAGKSNVGKSTLINSLTNKKGLANVSSKPGHTKLLNYFNIDEKFYLVDAPGYGYASGGLDLDKLFGDMMSNYFEDNKYLKLVLVLLDGRREIDNNDKELISFVQDYNVPYFLIITKSDKLNQSEKYQMTKRIKENGFSDKKVFFTSKFDIKSLENIRQNIDKMI